MYHRSEPAKIVNSQEELEELGDDWVDTPAALQDKPRKSTSAAAGRDVDPDQDPDSDDEDGDDEDGEDVEELEPAPAGSAKRKPTKRK